MKYFQLIDVDMPERWYIKGLWDKTGTRLDTREFRYGNSIEMRPHLQINSYEGVPVDVHFPLRVGLRNPGLQLDFTFETRDVPVVTGDVAELLLSIDENLVQIFPVMVETREHDSFIINVPSRIACIDTKRSEVEWWTEADDRPDKIGKPKAIYRLVVDPSLVQDRHLFRVEGWEIALIASERVKDLFEKAGVTGVEFEEV